MKKIIFFLLTVFIIFLPLKSQSYSEIDIVSVEKNPEIIRKLVQMEFDILMVWKERVYVLCNMGGLFRLQEENISFVLESANFYPFKKKEVSIQSGINGDYHSYLELEQDLVALESAYPHLAKVFDIGDSLEKRNIYALKISDNVSLDESEAEVFFCGCHHAREWISVEIPYLLGKYLVENYDKDPTIKKLVDNSEIWIIPLVNPDGLEYSIHVYRYWRKNRRNNGDGSYGIDINRNYGYEWGYDNIGSSPNPFSEVYRGEASFSEPEIQAVRDLFLQKNFQAMITYHSYSQLILYPWGYIEDPTLKDEEMKNIAAQMSGLIEAVNGNTYEYDQAGSRLYLTNGDTTDWTYGTFEIPSFTIELPPVDIFNGGFFNAEEEISFIFEENLPAALYLINWSIQNFSPDNLAHKVRKKLSKEARSIRK